jgi:7-carboxy-7-deazaguanine synthase
MHTSFLVNEIYPCLQGEGINIGKPSLLVRFQICNLRCAWCDTPYTHTFKSDPVSSTEPKGKQKFTRYSLNELVSKIQSFNVTHLILSGGEPTLHNIGLLMRSLGSNYTAEVESNGTRIPHLQIPNFLNSDYFLMQWNISPKFSNANEKINSESLEHWAKLSTQHDHIYFKFVIRKQEATQDLNEILKIIEEFKIPNHKIIIMTEGTDMESQISNIWLHDICLKHSFRYTPRLHVLLFGNLRGV